MESMRQEYKNKWRAWNMSIKINGVCKTKGEHKSESKTV